MQRTLPSVPLNPVTQPADDTTMRIGLDARTIFAPQRRGIGKSLLRLYQTLLAQRPDWSVVCYHREPEPDLKLLPGAELRYIEIPGDRFDAWLQWRLPIAARTDQIDVLHCPANYCPRWMPVPTVVTIHDLIPLDLPHTLDGQQVRRFRKSIDQAVRSATIINCPSQYTRKRLLGDFEVDPHRVHVTPWGADEPIIASQIEDALNRHRVARPFVLHFGSGEARKNTHRVLEAWSMIRPGARRDATLLVLGLSAEAQAGFMTTCQKLGIASSVVLSGFATDADAAALLRDAELLAYPSESEGFGLPLLEAFSAGTPVVTSDRTALPEVAGDAALLVDPVDTVEIADAMARLLRDQPLRQSCIERGHARVAGYTWSRCADMFARSIESAVGVAGWRHAA